MTTVRKKLREAATLATLAHVLAGTCGAQARTYRELAVLTDSSERYVERVPVSNSGPRVGVVESRGNSKLDPGWIFVAMPRAPFRSLCVTLSSSDGRYWAEYVYDARQTGTGAIPIRVPTRYRQALRGYVKRDVAILASVGASCSAAPTHYLIASWDSVTLRDSVDILLNIRVRTNVSLGTAHAESRVVPCTEIDGPRTAFNLRCSISPREISDSTRVIVRYFSGGYRDRFELPIARP